jgi:hypothetical protein
VKLEQKLLFLLFLVVLGVFGVKSGDKDCFSEMIVRPCPQLRRFKLLHLNHLLNLDATISKCYPLYFKIIV